MLCVLVPLLMSFFSAGYTASPSDNICGMTSVDKLFNPAMVDFALVMSETPEVKEMKRENISRKTPKGKILFSQAMQRITKECVDIMRGYSYCSVWKKIKHPTKKIDNITKQILARLE